jgi:hypothetical protein
MGLFFSLRSWLVQGREEENFQPSIRPAVYFDTPHEDQTRIRRDKKAKGCQSTRLAVLQAVRESR